MDNIRAFYGPAGDSNAQVNDIPNSYKRSDKATPS
jgi:hypothetical protein